MEKRARISTPRTESVGLEAMREHADTLEGILSGVYSALSQRSDIDEDILTLLAVGAVRAGTLAESLVAFRRPVLVHG